MTDHHMLKNGQNLETEGGMTCKVQRFLGGGGQGEVYEVSLANKPMALKWYFPNDNLPAQRKALETLIQKGAPGDKFLWPLELIKASTPTELGYLMALREPRYRDIVDLMMRRVNTTFRNLATAGLHLADSYYRLHTNGLCYRDISFGNVFLDPTNGEVLICDNDNVAVNGEIAGGVLGTSRFMAPEIVRHEDLPNRDTDLYSLAVLLFCLFMFHHPLEGKKESDIHVLDGLAMQKIYGHEPLFIFDPEDSSNIPIKGYQDNALIFWPLYPQFLRDIFTRAFTDGLRDPANGRVQENEWRSTMVKLRDSIFYCPHCMAQNFYDVDALKKNGGTPSPCWNCKKDVRLPFRIRINDNVIMLNNDTQLFPHHIDSNNKWNFSQPVAQVNRHPKDPNHWGLKNLSKERWVLVKPDGTKQEVDLERNAPLAVGVKINFGNIEGEVRY